MKISEIIQSTPEIIISKIGPGPYLYYSGNIIIIDCSLESIIAYHTQGGQVIDDIEIFAYGFKKDEADTRQYINAEDLKRRFEEMESNDSYEYIEPEEDNGQVLQVPSYCGFDELLYFLENNVDMMVNCKPIKDVVQEEYRKRMEKSNAIRN